MPRFGKQKNLEKKLFLVDILKATDEKSRIRKRNSLVPGTDLLIRICTKIGMTVVIAANLTLFI
jgi:hypothetical protein